MADRPGIGLLPGEAAVRVRRAAEVAIGGGPGIDRPVEIEVCPDAARGQAHDLTQRNLKLGLIHAAGAVQIDVNRQRFGDTDGIGQLDGGPVRQIGGDDILGQIAGGIGGGAVDLGRILAGEGTATMRGRATVGIDDDLAPGQAAVAIRAADFENAGGIDVPHGALVDPAGRQGLDGDGANDLGHIGGGQAAGVLGGDDDLRGADGLAVFIGDRHLALGIRLQPLVAALAGIGQVLEDLVRIIDRGRHQLRRLAAGIAEHDALVARAFILVAGAVDADGNIGGLGMEMHLHGGLFPVEPLLLIADIADGHAGGVGDQVAGDLGGAAGLTGDHDAVGRRQRFGGAPQMPRVPAIVRAEPEEGIDDLIRNAVAHLVGMAFGYGFTGEQVIGTSHDFSSEYKPSQWI